MDNLTDAQKAALKPRKLFRDNLDDYADLEADPENIHVQRRVNELCDFIDQQQMGPDILLAVLTIVTSRALATAADSLSAFAGMTASFCMALLKISKLIYLEKEKANGKDQTNTPQFYRRKGSSSTPPKPSNSGE
jgi:hypothetical protein